MAFDACGIGQAVIEVVKTDDVNDVEDIAIVEAKATKLDDIVFTRGRRCDRQFDRIVEHSSLSIWQINFRVVLLNAFDKRIVVSFATESLSVGGGSITTTIGRGNHSRDHLALPPA